MEKTPFIIPATIGIEKNLCDVKMSVKRFTVGMSRINGVANNKIADSFCKDCSGKSEMIVNALTGFKKRIAQMNTVSRI
jgi:hypothetical protein